MYRVRGRRMTSDLEGRMSSGIEAILLLKFYLEVSLTLAEIWAHNL